MARIRTIKPAFFRHRVLYRLEQSSGLPVRVGFAGLWTVADREGRFRWKPEELQLDCLPYDGVDFSAVLEALAGAGFVQKYAVAGKDYGCVPSWSEHQVINSREAQSLLPSPPNHGGIAVTGNCNVEEEKEEEKEKEGKGRGTEDSPEALTRSEPVLLEFPTVGPGGSAWRLRRVQVDEWQEAYPNLDVMAECRKALSWVKANLGRRKTSAGMPKFLNGWLSRSVDSGRVSVAAPAAVASDVDWFEECQAMHGGACGERMRHSNRKGIDEYKARNQAS